MKFEEYLKKFGKEIKKRRIDADISQEELAFKADLHISLISRIENGKANTSFESIFKLAKALNVEINKLFQFK